MTSHKSRSPKPSNHRSHPRLDQARSGQASPRTPKPESEARDFDIGIKARDHAVRLVNQALSGRGGWDSAVQAPEFLGLELGERAFARACALVILRHLGEIDAILSMKLAKAPPEAVIALLRLGVAQVFFMGVADFAAVSTTLKLAERDGATRPFKGLINAVLRGLLRDGKLPAIAPERRLPDWLSARWRQSRGPEVVRALSESMIEDPPTDLSFKNRSDRDLALGLIEGEALGETGLRTLRRGDVRDWPGFEDGCWWVQDVSAAAAVGVLEGDLGGLEVLDVCAAPGGKTLQLAARGAQVTALDRSQGRLKRLAENLKRTGLNADTHMADAAKLSGPDWDGRQFDIVVLDAPCSATGTFRRQPEVLWAVKPSDLGDLCDVQHRLMDVVASRVRPGGRLVYCVCSLEHEEGEQQVTAFLRRHPHFHTQKLEPETVAFRTGLAAQSVTTQGWVRALPHQKPLGQDGFFIAVLNRHSGG